MSTLYPTKSQPNGALEKEGLSTQWHYLKLNTLSISRIRRAESLNAVIMRVSNPYNDNPEDQPRCIVTRSSV